MPVKREPVRCIMCGKQIPQASAKRAGASGTHWQCRNEQACINRCCIRDMMECAEEDE